MTARIVLVDSGVDPDHPHVRDAGAVVVGPAIGDDGTWQPDGAQADVLGHGTAAAAAILDLARGSTLYSVQVFRERPACPFEHVLVALEHALELDPDLINLSLGTTRRNWIEPLSEVAARAAESKVALVAPGTFGGLPSYPGSLEGVTGVLMDADLPRERPERRTSGSHSFRYASPYPRDLPGLPRDSNLVGVSMSCANVTGFLARSM